MAAPICVICRKVKVSKHDDKAGFQPICRRCSIRDGGDANSYVTMNDGMEGEQDHWPPKCQKKTMPWVDDPMEENRTLKVWPHIIEAGRRN